MPLLGVGILTPLPVYVALIIKLVRKCLNKNKNQKKDLELEESKEMLEMKEIRV